MTQLTEKVNRIVVEGSVLKTDFANFKLAGDRFTKIDAEKLDKKVDAYANSIKALEAEVNELGFKVRRCLKE